LSEKVEVDLCETCGNIVEPFEHNTKGKITVASYLCTTCKSEWVTHWNSDFTTALLRRLIV